MSFLDPGEPVRVKICGITAKEDASTAIAAGADALGFNFFRGSKRHISFEENQAWIKSLAGQTFRVAVVVNAERDELLRLRDSECFEAVQFHGDETPKICAGAARSRPRLSLRSPAIGQRSGRPQPISRASWTARRRSNRKR